MISKINFNYINSNLKTSFRGINKQEADSATGEEIKEEYYKNGQIKSRIVINKKTKRKIEETFYFENGKKSSQATYDPETGVIKSYLEWYETGRRMSRACYDSKGRILEDISWYDDGSVRSYRREDGAQPIHEIYY